MKLVWNQKCEVDHTLSYMLQRDVSKGTDCASFKVTALISLNPCRLTSVFHFSHLKRIKALICSHSPTSHRSLLFLFCLPITIRLSCSGVVTGQRMAIDCIYVFVCLPVSVQVGKDGLIAGIKKRKERWVNYCRKWRQSVCTCTEVGEGLVCHYFLLSGLLFTHL